MADALSKQRLDTYIWVSTKEATGIVARAPLGTKGSPITFRCSKYRRTKSATAFSLAQAHAASNEIEVQRETSLMNAISVH
jgi:hypothetical protein